jgi:PAS domain S-box-containing protein
LTAQDAGIPNAPQSRELLAPIIESPAAQGLLASIVASSDDAIISKTLDGIITSWNQGAERLFGYTPSEAIGKPILMLIPADLQHEEEVILSRIRRGERIEHYETIRQAKDGHLIEISLTISPIVERDGRIVGASKIARDIGPQKQIRRQLEEADQRKNEFLALLAHELRNPLGPIRHAVNILRAKTPTTSELDWATSIISRQADHMARLVEDLLDVSRITRGAIELRRERVDVAAVIKGAVEASSALIDKSHHHLKVTVPREPLHVEGDITRLVQIVSNLLDNAAKYTQPGGRIALTATRDDQSVVIQVRDTGIGISAELLPRIFDMFTQAELPMERSQGGLGVGLALVDRLVTLHGGTVTAQSEGKGKGSEFTVRLPLAERVRMQPAREATGGALEPLQKGSSRVLVVDDNVDSADSLAILLRMMGHEVRTSHEAEEALASAATFHPDVAILDIGMPRMNGYDLAQRLREQPWAKNLVLVALTGWGQEEHRRRSAESGFDHHLTKPVELDVLQRILTEVENNRPDRRLAAR